MSDPRSLFAVLNDGAGVGTAPDKAIDATTAAAALKGLVGFAFKDSTGKVILPQLDALGRVPVTSVVGVEVNSPAGELAAGSLSLVAVTGAEIDLTVDKKYTNLSIDVCSRQDSLFQLIWLDDVTETVLKEYIVGPGQYTIAVNLANQTVTAGASGDQKLFFKAKNFETLSSLRASLSALEVA